jgi:superfamily II DNA or RNA helicase
VIERLSGLNQGKYDLNDAAIKLVLLSESISNQKLAEKFAKKKMSVRDYFNQLDSKTIDEQIRPFVEKVLKEMLALLVNHSINLYDGSAVPNLFPEDLITIEAVPAETRLRFIRKENGTIYQLEVYFRGEKLDLTIAGNNILLNDPAYLLTGNRILSFNEGITGKIISPFLKHERIEIPKKIEVKYFETFIKKLILRSDIEAEGFQVKDLELDPQPFISIENSWMGGTILVLSFLYSDRKIFCNDSRNTFIKLVVDDNGFIFYRFKRNRLKEDVARKQLISMGLKFEDSVLYVIEHGKQVKSSITVINWLTYHRQEFQEFGFIIESNLGRNYLLEIPELKTRFSAEFDWFDLYAEVSAGTFKLPFIRFRDHILTKNREFILPDGQVVLLPEEWFSRYQQVFLYARDHKGTIRLRKHHFSLLMQFDLPEVHRINQELFPESSNQIPLLQNITLRNYQKTGFYWLKGLAMQGFGGILADDMGLGKTIQMITILCDYYPESDDQVQDLKEAEELSVKKSEIQLDLFNPPEEVLSPVTMKAKKSVSKDESPASLIIMPSSLIHNWENELTRLAPRLRVLNYAGLNRQITTSKLRQYHVVLTTFGILRNDIDKLASLNFGYIVLDESQHIKNASSKGAQAARALQGSHRVALTGTPVENHLADLWSQMEFVNPGLLGSHQEFLNTYNNAVHDNPDGEATTRLLQLISPYILRRTKESVTPELPLLTESVTCCSMSEEQLRLYESEKSKARNFLLEKFENEGISRSGIWVLKALMRLRQLACHPDLIDENQGVESGKFEEFKGMLDTVIQEGHKVLVFSSFLKHLMLAEKYCLEQGYGYVVLKGSTTNREQVINTFRKDPACQVFLISLKAGGVGLNLMEADYVFILDPWWNPAAEMQAIGRAHRIGQQNRVFVYKFITKDSVEEKILRLQEKKKRVASLIAKPSQALANMSKEEVLELFN